MSEVWINDVDLADYGFVLGANPGHADAPQFSDALAPLLGGIGPTWLAEPVQAGARRLLIAGDIRQSTAALYRAAIDSLKLLASVGAVRIRFADRPDQEFRDCRLTSASATPRTAILSNIAGQIAFVFEVADPLRYDVNPQGIPLSSSRAYLPIGTMPSDPVITIHGGGASLTDPTLTYRNAAGDIEQTMGFTGVLAADEYLIIDRARTQVTKSDSGVQSDALSWWTSGDFPVIRAADGWQDLEAYPTMELGGTGTPFGLCTFHRAWL